MRKLLITTMLAATFVSPAFAETVHVGVNGLVCAFCVKGIKKGFSEQPSVESVDVDMDNKLVTVVTKPDQKIDDATIKNIISEVGYSTTSIHHQE